MTMHNLKHQQGAALITALILMMALTLYALASMSTTTTQLTISGNDESTVEAYERAQSIVDAVVEVDTNFKVTGGSGYSICTSNISGCDLTTITLSGIIFDISGTRDKAKIERLVPENIPMPRAAESSGDKFETALFSVTGSYDNVANGTGKAEVVQGYLLLIPKTSQ